MKLRMELVKELASSVEGYDVDDYGRITSPGKFEGNPWFVPYLWEQTLHGASSAEGDGWIALELLPVECTIFGVPTGSYALLSYNEQGFVSYSIYTQKEFTEFQEIQQ